MLKRIPWNIREVIKCPYNGWGSNEVIGETFFQTLPYTQKLLIALLTGESYFLNSCASAPTAWLPQNSDMFPVLKTKFYQAMELRPICVYVYSIGSIPFPTHILYECCASQQDSSSQSFKLVDGIRSTTTSFLKLFPRVESFWN